MDFPGEETDRHWLCFLSDDLRRHLILANALEFDLLVNAVPKEASSG
jgi:hypothetical protein